MLANAPGDSSCCFKPAKVRFFSRLKSASLKAGLAKMTCIVSKALSKRGLSVKVRKDTVAISIELPALNFAPTLSKRWAISSAFHEPAPVSKSPAVSEAKPNFSLSRALPASNTNCISTIGRPSVCT